MTKETIEKLQDTIESVLSENVDPENGHAVKEQLAAASRLLVSSTNCITSAKGIYLRLHSLWLRQHKDELAAMKPSVAKTFSDTSLVDEQILLVRCEQNYKNLCRYSDNLVTILSYLKAEMSIQ
jgi:hypothetical protein